MLTASSVTGEDEPTLSSIKILFRDWMSNITTERLPLLSQRNCALKLALQPVCFILMPYAVSHADIGKLGLTSEMSMQGMFQLPSIARACSNPFFFEWKSCAMLTDKILHC